MKLNEVVPWGRSLEEYKSMFNMNETDLNKKILGCGDGPASFNSEMTALGYSVISIDPIYQFSAVQIKERIQANYEPIISQVKQNDDRYMWNNFRDADELGRARLAVMEKFLSDYQADNSSQRYLPLCLPTLDFPDGRNAHALRAYRFELCLCSHLLFLYSEHLSLDFHISSIYELMRIAPEIRIFPLVKLDCKRSPYIDSVIQEFSEQGFQVEVQNVSYEFQKGGDQMLKIQR
ncbi:hypothetical protein [Mastigocoleus testarum]|uniref:SAM-dependent methyltransferase n=1 Tax=Mastigocoleus testarum BC008 TaxID=371196 RepID=A0A0V7ZNR2_9CYAN|nr:hypothetical protein [Mastigocoleus testarum]KST66113.1 SAM-dependent methyltransferase [Mastigocoleus testarum BC008]